MLNNFQNGLVDETARPDPHLFMVAEEAYQDLIIDEKSQSIIVTGESGAGKTEATKIILSYLAKCKDDFSSMKPQKDLSDSSNYLSNEASLEKQVLDSNPLLEAFGNAKTVMNNNSSRFGKFIQVNVDPSGKITSATIKSYILEKSRIVHQNSKERNFHIFYYIFLDEKIIELYDLEAIENYTYLANSFIKGIQEEEDRLGYSIMRNCLGVLGFSDTEYNEIIDLIVGILNLGNIDFNESYVVGKSDQAFVSDSTKQYLERVSKFFGVDFDFIEKSLTSHAIKIAGEFTLVEVGKNDAIELRDTMSKIVYARMFNWIISRINETITGNISKKTKYNFIGLLDIFGFEIFKNNWFEQLCINYANEKLQQHFNNYMFQNEQTEYQNEGLNTDNIKFKDNQKWIDLIEKSSTVTPSIFSLLDEFSLLNKNNSNKSQKNIINDLKEKFDCNLMYNEHYENWGRSRTFTFTINHFAGKVEYNIEKFLEKNKDSVSPLIESVLANSSNSILMKNFKDLISEGVDPQDNKQSKGTSLAFQFKEQLNGLVKVLNVSSPRYVRWIKPNNQMKPKLLDSFDSWRQLRWAGVLEAIRIRKIGYPIRKLLNDFIRRYKPILSFKDLSSLKDSLPSKVWSKILTSAGYPNDKRKWQIGHTKVFMKEEVRQVLERELGNALVNLLLSIEKNSIWSFKEEFRGFRYLIIFVVL